MVQIHGAGQLDSLILKALLGGGSRQLLDWVVEDDFGAALERKLENAKHEFFEILKFDSQIRILDAMWVRITFDNFRISHHLILEFGLNRAFAEDTECTDGLLVLQLAIFVGIKDFDEPI